MIHETAIIDTKTKISSNVSIGPYTVIGPDVEIGENTIIHSHVNIAGHTKIGKRNKIYPFASIGNDPQSRYLFAVACIAVANQCGSNISV